MSDWRTTPFNGRVAHVSLRGKVDAEEFVEGQKAVVVTPVANLLAAPERDAGLLRQLLAGETVTVLEYRDAHAFVVAGKDGYVGWTPFWYLTEVPIPKASHVVKVRATHLYPEPDIKCSGRAWEYSIGAQFCVVGQEGAFAEVLVPLHSDSVGAEDEPCERRFVPSAHLRALTEPEVDPVAVAERLLGVPYLWGGNSAHGIDCSGLVQAGCMACGIACPGDSDMQAAQLGVTLPADAVLQRGDVVFWKGHVGWIAGENLLLHANAIHMAVAFEPLDAAIARIKRQGDGDVTRYARLEDGLHD